MARSTISAEKKLLSENTSAVTEKVQANGDRQKPTAPAMAATCLTILSEVEMEDEVNGSGMSMPAKYRNEPVAAPKHADMKLSLHATCD